MLIFIIRRIRLSKPKNREEINKASLIVVAICNQKAI